MIVRLAIVILALVGSNSMSFAYDYGYPSGRTWTDINQDGRLDYCRVVGDQQTQRVACTLATQDGQNEQNPPNGTSIISQPIDWGNDLGRGWIDINSDGVADYCRVVGSTFAAAKIRCLMIDKARQSFEGEEIESPWVDWGYPDTRVWLDVNIDGIPDFCRAVGNIATPFVRCLLASPETKEAGMFFGKEIDFLRKDEAMIAFMICGLRHKVLIEHKLYSDGPDAVSQASFANMVSIVSIIARIMSTKGDQHDSQADHNYKDIRDLIFKRNQETGKEIFKGDVPEERIKWAGTQS